MPLRPLALSLAALALALPAAACGTDEEAAVRDTLDAFAEATAQKDYQRLCDTLFARSLVEEVAKVLPCEAALRNSSLDDARSPNLEVRSVSVDGKSATTKVGSSAANQKPSEDTVRLVKEDGEWRVVSLAS